MSDLSNIEKRSFEKIFGMSSGYVLNFTNRTFEEFILDSTGKSIYDGMYDNGSGSKANRLRAFWTTEPNYVVAKLLRDLLSYVEELGVKQGEEPLVESCLRAVNRLSQTMPVPEIEAISPNRPDKDFAILAKSVRDSIERNEPESGLDRLHAFVIMYMRVLCEGHGITWDKEKPLHSLLGEYAKCLKEKGHIESEMTERILKSSISILESFNRVRNDHSLAHPNKILNYDESLLIFNHVASVIRFIEALERRIVQRKKQESTSTECDEAIPF